MSRIDDGSRFEPSGVSYELPVAAELPVAVPPDTPAGPPDHRLGHRKRLRERFLVAGPDGIAPYELLELILFQAQPRSDKKALAKALLERFGTFAEVLTAPADRLLEVKGIGESAVTAFRIIEAASHQLLKGAVVKRTFLESEGDIVAYCRSRMAFGADEEFRVLFFDKRNKLLRDEALGSGTVDHAPVYPRKVIKRALELNASALILAHNHPSGDPAPSNTDVLMTRQIVTLGKALDIQVHDHLIVGRDGHASMRKLKLI